MLKKLVLFDLSSLRRRVMPLIFSMLLTALLSLLVVLSGTLLPLGDAKLVISDLLTAVLYLIILAFFVLLFLAILQIFLHYYRSFFTSEGYFTFMIPAAREQLFLSKVLSGLLFALLIFFAAVLSVTIGVLLPFEIAMRTEDLSFLSVLLRSLFDGVTPLSVIDLLIATCAQIMTAYTAITMGALFFRKRKLLGALLFYLVLTLAVLFLRTLGMLLFLAITYDSEIYTNILSILLWITVSVFSYLFSRTLLGQKLNLT